MAKIWYAVEDSNEIYDWGYGSDNYDEAVAMLRKVAADCPTAQIAIVDDGDDPVCTDVITLDDID